MSKILWLALLLPTLASAQSSNTYIPSAPYSPTGTPTNGQCLTYVAATKTYTNASCGAGGSGTVTSVAETVPAGFAIAGSPVTTAGTLAISYATGQTANSFLATPSGSTGALSLRTITLTDLPTGVALTGSANNFTQNQQISETEPRLLFDQTGAGTDQKLWDIDLASLVWCLRTRTDADATGQNVVCATRGTTTSLTNITLGYSAAGSYTFPFTGTATFSGALSVTGRYGFGATTVSASGNSIYLVGSNSIGGSTGGTQRFTIDANGALNWNAAIVSAGTKPTVTGCSNSTTLGGVTAGSFVSGTSGTCTVTITLPTGPTNGYACFAHDDTTAVDYTQSAIVTSTTTLTISGTTVSGDKITWACPSGY